MGHAITVGDVMIVIGVVGGLALLAAILIGVIALMNPFRSGH